MRHGWRRGARLRYLREFIGLDPIRGSGAAPAIRAEAVRRACRITIGTTVEFRAGAGGACHLAGGWSHPEADGVWNDGPSATLMFDLGAPPTNDLRFTFSLGVFTNPRRSGREVAIETMRGQRIDRWILSAAASDCSIVVPADAWIGSRLGLRFRFDESISPSDLGLSGDHRALAIKLHRLCVCPT
jgi:hypothetical protein